MRNIWVVSHRAFWLLFLAMGFAAHAQHSPATQDKPEARVESICCDFEPVIGNKPDIYSIDRFLFEFDNRLSVDSHYVSRPRIWRDIARADNVCTIRARKTPERAAVSYFTTKPHSLYPPLRLIMPSELASKYGDVPINLGEILTRDDLMIGVVQNQDYGQIIRAWVADNPQHFFAVPSHDKAQETLIRTALAGRVQAFIGDSRTVDDFIDQMGDATLSVETFARLPIEGLDANLGFIACSRSKTGRAIIDVLDETLANKEALEALYNVHLSWFPASERLFLKRLFADIYGFHLAPEHP